MYRFLILGLLFRCVYETQACTAVKYSGVVKAAYLFRVDTVYTYSYNLDVADNGGNSSYPNILTVTNFTETFTNGYSRISPLEFVIDSPDGLSNETVSCSTMNETTCVIPVPNGSVKNIVDLNYITVYDNTKMLILNGEIIDGLTQQTLNRNSCLSGLFQTEKNDVNYEFVQQACCTVYSENTDPTTDIGTKCSDDVSLAWLDIVYVIDISSGMPRIQDLLAIIATIMEGVNIGQIGDHSTRLGLVTYLSKNVTTVTQLNDTTNGDDFETILGNIVIDNSDPGGNIVGGLMQAFNLISSQRGYRKPVIVLAAASYDYQGDYGLNKTANEIQNDGISLVVLNYNPVDSLFTDILKSLGGYYYYSTQNDLVSAMHNGFTQINCFCPPSTLQFSVFNAQWSNYTKYADCYRPVAAPASPGLAQKRDCPPGSLIALTSKQKLDFVVDNFFLANQQLSGIKRFNIGLHKSSDGTWKWWGYNNTDFPYDNYPPMSQTPAPQDDYGYMFNNRGFNWQLKTGHNAVNSYICQTRACDASNVCKN